MPRRVRHRQEPRLSLLLALRLEQRLQRRAGLLLPAPRRRKPPRTRVGVAVLTALRHQARHRPRRLPPARPKRHRRQQFPRQRPLQQRRPRMPAHRMATVDVGGPTALIVLPHPVPRTHRAGLETPHPHPARPRQIKPADRERPHLRVARKPLRQQTWLRRRCRHRRNVLSSNAPSNNVLINNVSSNNAMSSSGSISNAAAIGNRMGQVMRDVAITNGLLLRPLLRPQSRRLRPQSRRNREAPATAAGAMRRDARSLRRLPNRPQQHP